MARKALLIGLLNVVFIAFSGMYLKAVLEYRIREEVTILQEQIDCLEEQIKGEPVWANVTVTAYSASTRETDSTPRQNAIMERPRPGDVAVSRSLLEKGWVPGRDVWIYQVGRFRIADLLSDRWEDDRLDVFIGNRSEALQFGRRETIAALLD